MIEYRLDSDLLDLLPPWYRRILDYQQICGTEQTEFETIYSTLNAVNQNLFLQTMDEGTVSQWESIFGITADPETETLDFRRARVINRLSMQPPFTLRFLYQKLDELIGKGKWEVNVDYPNYTLYIKSSAVNQSYAIEVAYTVNHMKPAHIVYINQPFLSEGITLDEQVIASHLVYYYKLGSWGLGVNPFADGGYRYILGEWMLGSGPFMEPGSREVIVTFGEKSIQPALLSSTANFVSSDIASIRLNGEISISDLTKSVSESTVTVEYTVTPQQAEIITLIELLAEDGTVLTSSTVYVPVTSPAVFTHTIPVQEATA